MAATAPVAEATRDTPDATRVTPAEQAPGPDDDYFGFSVVSSGYPCTETTFAHELGHNLGLTHDIDTVKESDGVLDDPDDYGGFDYSFGYRTGPGQGDFTTVMTRSRVTLKMRPTSSSV